MTTSLRLLPIILIFSLTLFSASFAYAQGLSQTDYNYSSSYSDGGNLTNATQTYSDQNLLSSFNWKWILPLILIPAGLMLLRGSSSEFKTSSAQRYNYQIAYHDIWGVKKNLGSKETKRSFKKSK